MTEVRERLRARIAETINNSDLTRKEIAEELGVSQVSISNWINGKNAPDFDTLVQFCNLFDVTLNAIFGMEPLDSNGKDTTKEELFRSYDQLNLTGRIKLADFADDLVASGKYKPYEP